MMRIGLVSLLFMIGATACAISSDPENTEEPEPGPKPEGTTATVTHVFDGDSIEVETEGRTDEVRLIGINAPEGDECFGDSAREALLVYLEGREVSLVDGSDRDVDQYGRLLRYVYAGSENINGRMLADGNAVTLQGAHRYNDAFVEISNLAADAGYGMWAADACGPPPTPGMGIVDVQYDPPGPDDEHLDDEYVRIANRGEDIIALTGWTLRDESTQNRFVFGHDTLAPGDAITVTTSCGTDRADTLHWCSDRPIWSNDGDTVMLQDTSGNVADWWRYQDKERR